MQHDLKNLEAERIHVGKDAPLDDLFRIDIHLFAVGEAFGEKALRGGERLQIVLNARFVEGNAHGGLPWRIAGRLEQRVQRGYHSLVMGRCPKMRGMSKLSA